MRYALAAGIVAVDLPLAVGPGLGHAVFGIVATLAQPV